MEEYKKLLKHRVRYDHNGDPVLPKYYYVPKEVVEDEKQEPGSQTRQVSQEGLADDLFLWGQSLYIIASLLAEGLVHVNELDLIRRYLPSYNRPRKVGGRYSAFQVLLDVNLIFCTYLGCRLQNVTSIDPFIKCRLVCGLRNDFFFTAFNIYVNSLNS